jgi:hypothetical protein
MVVLLPPTILGSRPFVDSIKSGATSFSVPSLKIETTKNEQTAMNIWNFILTQILLNFK